MLEISIEFEKVIGIFDLELELCDLFSDLSFSELDVPFPSLEGSLEDLPPKTFLMPEYFSRFLGCDSLVSLSCAVWFRFILEETVLDLAIGVVFEVVLWICWLEELRSTEDWFWLFSAALPALGLELPFVLYLSCSFCFLSSIARVVLVATFGRGLLPGRDPKLVPVEEVVSVEPTDLDLLMGEGLLEVFVSSSVGPRSMLILVLELFLSDFWTEVLRSRGLKVVFSGLFRLWFLPPVKVEDLAGDLGMLEVLVVLVFVFERAILLETDCRGECADCVTTGAVLRFSLGLAWLGRFLPILRVVSESLRAEEVVVAWERLLPGREFLVEDRDFSFSGA